MREGQVLKSHLFRRAFVFEMRDIPGPVDLSSSCIGLRSFLLRLSLSAQESLQRGASSVKRVETKLPCLGSADRRCRKRAERDHGDKAQPQRLEKRGSFLSSFETAKQLPHQQCW